MIKLICVDCGNVREHPDGTTWQGKPVEEGFASQGYLCTSCLIIASNAPGGVRADDPPCSKLGALKVFGRTGNQRAKLFEAFVRADPLPLTDYDAAWLADMLRGTTCYWKRCGELRERGVLRFNGRSQLTDGSDVPRGLSEVTPLGRKLWGMWA